MGVKVKEIFIESKWVKKPNLSVQTLEIIKTLEDGINEFMESRSMHEDRLIDIKYQSFETDGIPETSALIIYRG